MKIRIGELRKIIRAMMTEIGGGAALPRSPYIRNAMGPEISDREQLGKISKGEDPDELSPHLREPVYDYEDCYGPVPPTDKNPYMVPDPYTRDTSPLPTPPIKR